MRTWKDHYWIQRRTDTRLPWALWSKDTNVCLDSFETEEKAESIADRLFKQLQAPGKDLDPMKGERRGYP